MKNKKNSFRLAFLCLLFVLPLVSCNQGKEGAGQNESQIEIARKQAPSVTFGDCDSLFSSLNYRYGLIFKIKDSVQENVNTHHLIRKYYGHFDEKVEWGETVFYTKNGIYTGYVFPINDMENPIEVFKIDGTSQTVEAFGKSIKYDEIFRFEEKNEYDVYGINALSYNLTSSNDVSDSNDVLTVTCSFGCRKDGVRHVFHRSFVLDIASKSCVSFDDYVGPCYWTNDHGEVVGSGQIYAEKGFGGLAYGYIYMSRMDYLGWSTKLQEYNPVYNNRGGFPYETPNKSWSFGELDPEFQMPVSMSRGDDRYEFDYSGKVITHYVNNKRTEALYYDDELDDPRVWSVGYTGAKVKEFDYAYSGQLYRVKYWNRNRTSYMPMVINEKGKEERAWEIYRVNDGEPGITKVVDIDYDYHDDCFVIGELDETTGLYDRVKTIWGENDLKQYLLTHYLGW